MQGPATYQNIIANTVVVSGANGGTFVYAGVPGPGNPPLAWMADSATDPYGNALPSKVGVSQAGDFKATDTAGDYVQLSAAQINLFLAGGSTLTPANINGGAGLLSLLSGTRPGGGEGGGGVRIMSQLAAIANGYAGTTPVVDFSGSAILAVPGQNLGQWKAFKPGSVVNPETWNDLGTLTGYTVNVARYRLSPDNGEVEFDINLTGTGANGTLVAFSTTLASPYLPTPNSKTYPLTTNLAIASMTTLPRVGITTGGTVQVAGTANIANTIVYSGGFFMPTD